MSQLVTLEDVSLAFGLAPLLNHIKLQINKGERICLIGRNGAGKSSLLKIIEGSLQPDNGFVWRKPDLRIARLDQKLPQNNTLTVYEYVAEGLAEIGKLLADYHQLTIQLAQKTTPFGLRQLELLQHQLDAKGGWQMEQQIKSSLSRLSLQGDKQLKDLSGGWQRAAALAKSLVAQPELLLLDEPTNHLDIETIQWLEEQLISTKCTLLFITHDRALLQRLATRIVDLEQGKLTSWPGDYHAFLQHKEEELAAQLKHQIEFDEKLAQEERWIRQGIKARRTRNEGRVRALKAMRLERLNRLKAEKDASFTINEAEKSGQLVIEAQHLSHTFSDHPVVTDFSTRIMRGDRIGLVGPNGIGKSTLLKILLGDIAPQQGSVTQGTKLQIAYFDQQRQILDPNKTVMENVVEGSDTVEINGKKRHIISYLNDFLFSRERIRTQTKALSGGETNRLLLARLFIQPANVLVMDEPTNDLDIETLELLEEKLNQFTGTLLIASHDRTFLDNVVTSILLFEGKGTITEYIGGYQDMIIQREPQSDQKESIIYKNENKLIAKVSRPSKKLSYKEQKELDELPKRIELLEEKERMLQEELAQDKFYSQSQDLIIKAMNQLKQLRIDIETSYVRWEELEQLVKSFHKNEKLK